MSKEILSEYRNYYHCPRCGTEWGDEWDSQCDDDCPDCGNRHISPYQSEDINTGEIEIHFDKDVNDA